jgi:hypothetical protein
MNRMNRIETEGEEIYQARAINGELLAGKAPPADIQWMPPGTHTVSVTRVSDGEAVDITLTVDAAAAEAMQACLSGYLAKATAGKGPRPYFDFDHLDHEASGRPTKFFWAGEDPVKGGVRCSLDWTKPGGEAVTGGSYDKFSPNFIPKAGRVTGAPVNMGGLVNAPAFQAISPLMAKQGNNHINKNAVMTEKEIADLQAENARLKGENGALQAKAASATTQTEVLRLQTENERLKAENEAVKAKQARGAAEAAVDTAVRAGKLPAKNTALRAKWVDQIIADPGAAELLEAMPASAALATVTRETGAEGHQTTHGAKGDNHPFVVRAKERAIKTGEAVADCMGKLAKTEPELYLDYVEAL